MDGIQPVMNVGNGYGYGDGFGFGGTGLWLFAILALMNGGFGGWANRGYGLDGRVATVEDLNNSTNFARLENQVRFNENAIQSGFTNLGNGICSLGYQLATDKGELSKEIAECCCGVNRNIDAVRYENAINTANVNANTTAGIQKVLDAIAQNKIEGLQSQVNQLQLQSALCGVVRYPTSTTYATYCNPFGYNYNCNGCTNI